MVKVTKVTLDQKVKVVKMAPKENKAQKELKETEVSMGFLVELVIR